MDFLQTLAISAAGVNAEKARMEAAAANIANMNSSSPPGAPGYRPLTAVIHAVPAPFAALAGGASPPVMMARADIVPQAGAGVRTTYEPGHPYADAQGMVAHPAIDHTQEMMTVVTAVRAYEANLAVIQVTKTLAAKALDIGGR